MFGARQIKRRKKKTNSLNFWLTVDVCLNSPDHFTYIFHTIPLTGKLLVYSLLFFFQGFPIFYFFFVSKIVCDLFWNQSEIKKKGKIKKKHHRFGHTFICISITVKDIIPSELCIFFRLLLLLSNVDTGMQRNHTCEPIQMGKNLKKTGTEKKNRKKNNVGRKWEGEKIDTRGILNACFALARNA